jgi:hypothetical protein
MSSNISQVNMQKIPILMALLSIFVFQVSVAAEIDSITPRDLQLDNSLTLINEIFNQRIQEGVHKANAKQDDIEDIESGEFCDEQILYTELRKAIFQSFTASWGFKGYDLDQQLRDLLARESYSLPLKDSIYCEISYSEGFSLNMKELSAVVNINGHFVGLDKMGHFFAEGWHYFELTDYDQNNIDQALEWGKEQEAGKFGYSTTGIFSFADLVANFNGWRFWNKVLLNTNDPLKGAVANFFNRPYVSCELQIISSIKNKKIVKAWESNSQFDLADYLDGAWDEGNNCNNYEDQVITDKITTRIQSVNPDFTCPCMAEYCFEAQRKYGYYAKDVLHPDCLNGTN